MKSESHSKFRRHLHLRQLLIAATFACVEIATAGADSSPSAIAPANSISHWRFGIGGTQMPGVKAEFNDLGTFASPFEAKPLGGGRNYQYDDGFAKLDSSGNSKNLTWNWAYQNPTQYQAAGDGSIALSITNSQSDASTREEDDWNPGFEVFGYYDGGKVVCPPLEDLGANWGVRTSIGFTHIGIDNSAPLQTTLTRMTDTFSLGGVVPPPTPYTGSFAGPGPLLDDRPIRAVTETNGLVAGSRELDVDMVAINLGTYISVPVARDFELLVESGACVVLATGSYHFESNTTVQGLGTQTSSGKDSKSQLLPGGYAGVTGIYEFSESWAGLVSCRYQFLDSMDFQAEGSHSSLNFDSSFVITVGALYSF